MTERKKCIFCGRTEAELPKNETFTEEHIIPEALGNKLLKINNVCKKCNSDLGTYVDNYFVDNTILKMIRNQLKLKGQSGKIPNPFEKGIDKDGHVIYTDADFKPTYVSSVEENKKTGEVKIFAPSKKVAKEIAKKKLLRADVTPEKIRETLLRIDQMESHFSQLTMKFDFSIELSRFELEMIKIAYEFAITSLGDIYLEDPRGIELREFLNRAIRGEMREKCDRISGVAMMPLEIVQKIQQKEQLPCHLIMINKNADNQLIASIMLFLSPAFSYYVCVSNHADRYARTHYAFVGDVKQEN